MKPAARWALRLGLLGLGLGLVAALIWQADPRAVAQALTALGWGAGLFLLPSLGIYGLDVLAWRLSFRHPPGVGLGRLFLIRMAGESLNNTLPSAYLGGEPLKAYLLQQAGVPGSEGLASVIVGKTAMTVAQALFVLLGVVAAAIANHAHESLPALLGGSLLVAALFAGCMGVAYAAQRYGLGRLLAGFSARTGLLGAFVANQREGLDRLDRTLGDYYREDSRKFWISTAIFLLGWSCEILEVAAFCWLSGLAVGPWTLVALGSLATVVKAAGFFLPGSIGAQEGGNVLLFLAFGLSEATALAFSLLRRVRELCWIAFGFLALSWLGWPSATATPEPEPAAVEV